MTNAFSMLTLVLLALTGCGAIRGSDGLIGSAGFPRGAGISDGAPAAATSLIKKSTVRLQMSIKGSLFRCSGSVLAKDLILTAAHCLTTDDHGGGETLPPSSIVVIDGAGNRIQAKQVLVHPNYFERAKNRQYPFLQQGYDLGLVSLQTSLVQSVPVVLGDDVDRALASQSIHPLSIAGFGPRSGQTDVQLEDTVRTGRVWIDPALLVHSFEDGRGGVKRILQTIALNSGYARVLEFTKGPGNAGICRGDSGGPVYFEQGGQIHVIGVLSTVDPSAVVCTEIDGQPEQAVAMASDPLYYVLNAAKMISHAVEDPLAGLPKVPSEIPPETENPSTFAYYFSRQFTAEKNADLDLSDQVLIFSSSRSKEFNVAYLTPAKSFEGHCTGGGLQAMTFDRPFETGTVQAAYALTLPPKKVRSGELYRTFETRIKKLNLDYKIVVLTPSGYVAKTFSVKDVCEF
jgi:V8-like Glu-specific endopeptidase